MRKLSATDTYNLTLKLVTDPQGLYAIYNIYGSPPYLEVEDFHPYQVEDSVGGVISRIYEVLVDEFV
jgi:hypothetical protein